MKALIAKIQKNIGSFQMKHKFRDGQEVMFDGIMRALSNGIVRMYGEAPTGAGKTFIEAQVANAVMYNSDIRVLVITSRIKIMRQMLTEFAEFSPEHKVSLYGDGKQDLSGGIVVISYQGYLNLSLEQRKQFQVVELDEGHHGLGPKTRIALEEHSQYAILIGLTATAEYSSKKSLKNFLRHEAFNISIIEAIHWGIICALQMYWLELRVTIDGKIRGETKKQFEDRIVFETENYGTNEIFVKFYKQLFKPEGLRAVFFAIDKRQANDLLRHCKNHGVSARTIFGTTPKKEREIVFEDFENNCFDLLIGINVPGEGWDDVGLSVTIPTFPSLSKKDVTQKSGRSGRIDPSNLDKTSHVIVPNFNGKKQVFYSDIVNSSVPEEKRALLHQPKDEKRRGNYKCISQKKFDEFSKENPTAGTIVASYQKLQKIEQDKRNKTILEVKAELAKHGITSRVSLLGVASYNFNKLSFGDLGTGYSVARFLLPDSDFKLRSVNMKHLEKIAEILGWDDGDKMEKTIDNAKLKLKEYGITDRISLMNIGPTKFVTLKFGVFKGARALAGFILNTKIIRIKVNTLEQIAKVLGWDDK